MEADTSITLQNDADTTLVSIPFLVMVAAIEVALAARDALPQLANLLSLVDISTYMITIEEIGCRRVLTACGSNTCGANKGYRYLIRTL